MTGMWQWLRRFGWQNAAGGKLALTGEYTSKPCPEIPVVVVGDIHGRADLLDDLLEKISQQAGAAKLVFVGDYVDRGPQSRRVIKTLRGLENAICLCGNHEVMLLEFLDDPIEKGGRWLRNGGEKTLASYGIEVNSNSSSLDIVRASEMFRAALDDGSEAWLRQLPLSWMSGNLFVTHAGPDPARPVQGQDEKVYLWGHNRFLRDMRSDGIWVAHGHWIKDRVVCENGRIGVDAGAWASGRLTAALISTAGEVSLIVGK